jgi:hypothetical protein
MSFDEIYELYVTATNEIATLKDENKYLERQLFELKLKEKHDGTNE